MYLNIALAPHFRLRDLNLYFLLTTILNIINNVQTQICKLSSCIVVFTKIFIAMVHIYIHWCTVLPYTEKCLILQVVCLG